MLQTKTVDSGIPALNQVLGGLRLGDNVVFQVDRLENYLKVACPFVQQALHDGRKVVYLRFAPHQRIIPEKPGLQTIEVDPRPGFDLFSAQVNKVIEEQGVGVFYVFDNLSLLVGEWATDELLANFFQVTCPYLHELDTVAYFALKRGQHSHSAVARIRDTSQVVIDLYHVQNDLYIHPIKVFDRYSSEMFLPHIFTGETLTPVFRSGDASSILISASKSPLKIKADSIAPWHSVYRKLSQYDPEELERLEGTVEVQALKMELAQMLIGPYPEFRRLAERYLTIHDLLAIRNRLIGSGRIGGKAAGMLLARRILLSDPGPVDFSDVLEEHDSFFVGSDVFFTFLVNNGLFRLRLRLTRNSRILPEEFEAVEDRFRAGGFPAEIMEQFKDLLDYFGQAPIIVRSSSLLEDGFGNAFAGKYRSEFCVNQGSPEDRMEAFLEAIKLVYASAVNPDALAYRRQRGLGESDEQMAILIQRVSGMRHRRYFFPPLAGVAFSHNLYRWTDRIDPEQGMIRLVLGLGTRAVNRLGGDYTRLIAVSHPKLRPEAPHKLAVYSQHRMDVLDIAENRLRSLPMPEVVGADGFPSFCFFASDMKEGFLKEVEGNSLSDLERPVLTFDRLIARTRFVPIMRDLLAKLEAAYGYTVDTEFTAFVAPDGEIKVNLLQCRPMRLPGAAASARIPVDIAPERILFRANRTISGGVVRDIRYIVYIDPQVYARQTPLEAKRVVGRMVGRLNRHPEFTAHRIMMMGPGRWGSSNINLGVNATYSDINNAAILVEMAREEHGHVPDVSYGTHFFLDLVESRIIYLPLYPDESETAFNRSFFDRAQNDLLHLLPEAEGFEGVIKVIHVPSAAAGLSARLIADGRTGSALCYLTPADDPDEPADEKSSEVAKDSRKGAKFNYLP
ncbi:Pyruvate phosphate dikinase PEP/pyruvate-binding protein [uncultured Desulfatiglans sp.]|uniref:Pyruvate phosphate dikinase PEP/pyruvate-binding protein n=1 Tax=Uncultured Desulfatiglans sp. TaxID=1748965 RepID=A0A653A881_UNCDX|nr:Pyruvate phosphate dikinase PEP/pyruvate-binding protein [uncultured Desulfatiglans sp.]